MYFTAKVIKKNYPQQFEGRNFKTNLKQMEITKYAEGRLRRHYDWFCDAVARY